MRTRLLAACVRPGGRRTAASLSPTPALAAHRLAALALLLACLGLAACSPAMSSLSSQAKPLSPEASQPPAAYTLGPGDEMSISVWNNEDLVRTVIVDIDGRVDFPLAGQMDVRDKTLAEFKETLTRRLSDYLVDPIVTVNLETADNLTVYVLGEVNTPGAITPTKRITALEALATAGGLTEDANSRTLLPVRKEGDHAQVSQLGMFNDEAAALVLRKNDILYVPPSQIANIQTFFTRLNAIVSPLINLGTGIVLAPDVIDILKYGESQNGGGGGQNIIINN